MPHSLAPVREQFWDVCVAMADIQAAKTSGKCDSPRSSSHSDLSYWAALSNIVGQTEKWAYNDKEDTHLLLS